MKCPACSHNLAPHPAGPFQVDICREGCGGIWFDKAEFEKCDQHHEPFPAELLRVRKHAAVAIDRNKKRSCPKCSGQTLVRVVLDPETRFEIDSCPGCQGHWLDIGELARIREQDKTDTDMNQRIAAFQKKVQDQIAKTGDPARFKAFVQLLWK